MFWYYHAFLDFAVPVCICKIEKYIYIYKLQLFLDVLVFHAFLEFAVPVCTCKIEKYDEI